MTPTAKHGPLRIGVVGLNRRTLGVIIKGLAASPRAEVTAICSRSFEKATEVAQQLPTAKAFTSFEAMVQCPTIDAVFVCTPPELHHSMAMQAIRAGKHVACEKPLAVTLTQAIEMERGARQAGLNTVVNFTFRSGAGHRFFAEMLGRGVIGQLLHFTLGYWQARELLPLRHARSARMDIGPHAVDLLRWWLEQAGEAGIGEVCSTELAGGLGNAPGESIWQCLCRTPSGATGVIDCSRVAIGYATGVVAQFFGDRAALSLDFDVKEATVRLARLGDGRPEGCWRPLEIPSELLVSYDDFPAFHLDRIAGALLGHESFPSFADGLACQEVLEAAGTSGQERRWVAIGAWT